MPPKREIDRTTDLEALKYAIRLGEVSGTPIPWNPESIKEQIRAKVLPKNEKIAR